MHFAGNFPHGLAVEIEPQQQFPILFRQLCQHFLYNARQFRLLCLCRNIGIIGDHYVINGHGFGAVFPQPVVPLGTGNAGEIAGEVFRPHLGSVVPQGKEHVCGEFLQILLCCLSAGDIPQDCSHIGGIAFHHPFQPAAVLLFQLFQQPCIFSGVLRSRRRQKQFCRTAFPCCCMQHRAASFPESICLGKHSCSVSLDMLCVVSYR